MFDPPEIAWMPDRRALSLIVTVSFVVLVMESTVAIRLQPTQTAVSYPGVGRFRRAETGILGVEQNGGPTGPPLYFWTPIPTE